MPGYIRKKGAIVFLFLYIPMLSCSLSELAGKQDAGEYFSLRFFILTGRK